MKLRKMAAVMAAGLLLTAVPACTRLVAQQGQGETTVTVLPKNKEAQPVDVNAGELAIHVDGKPAHVTNWTPAVNGPLELVLLIDGSARTSLGRQLGEIQEFIRSLPPNVKVGVAYMTQGQAVFAVPLSSSHTGAVDAQRVPAGMVGTEGSPYFCLSDLARHWPSHDMTARREVIMITDGVDRYEVHYDPDDTYVQAAIRDSIRAHLVVYSIYWLSQGRLDATGYENNAGQSLLLQVTTQTGGNSYWFGTGNPVTFEPYFEDLLRRFRNQYELGVSGPMGRKPQVEAMKLTLRVPGAEVVAPRQVYITAGQP